MEFQMDHQKQAYQQEARELLGELENALMELEENPAGEDLISRVFRAMHTIKGSGSMFGFNGIAAVTHEVEAIFDLVRNNRMAVSKNLIDLSLDSVDVIAEMLNTSDDDMDAVPETARILMMKLKEMIPTAPSLEKRFDDSGNPVQHRDVSKKGKRQTTYRIRFRPAREIFSYGANPMLLLSELAELGECHMVSHNDGIPLLFDMEPELCYVFWDIILTTDQERNAIEDVFIFVSDVCQITIQVIDEDNGSDADIEVQKIGEILVDRGDLSLADIERMLDGKKRIGELLTEAGLVSPDAIESALVEQEHLKKIRKNRRQESENSATLRVDAEKLDVLVDLVGELVTVQARLTREASTSGNGGLMGIAEEVERLVNELRDNTMGIRMRPIGSTFNKFKRLVRDLSENLGKQVLLTTEGGETELDKTVLEKINDPLVHILRNSLDHGIETPEERAEKGKPAQGIIQLTASHMGANVVIQVKDDGVGLDPEAIRKTALAKGILSPDVEISEKELFDLLFQPGFSTAKSVTSVSGRGVGMDVVKKSIESLRGIIDVESRKGEGTTITLVLPLTLAIIEGFMVRIGEEHFVFPLAAVEECVEITGKDMDIVHQRNIMNIRGTVVPYRNLREVFGLGPSAFSMERVVVIQSGGQRMGFGVDKVIGQHQTVIKSLGKMYRDVHGLSGASILGDGTVALILDVGQLIHDAEKPL